MVADWTPDPHHEAFPGMLNGGIIGTLLDCHCNWTAALPPDAARRLEQPPCTVTAEYTIRMREADAERRARCGCARASSNRRASRVNVEGELEAGGRVTARAAASSSRWSRAIRRITGGRTRRLTS